MKRLFLLVMGTMVLIVPTADGGIDWIPFTVACHTWVPWFQAADFDAAINDVNDRMKYNNHNCTDDVPCTARFFRSGALGTFGTNSDGLDVITTQAELDSVFAVTTHRIKVVNVVDFCGGAFNPSIIGCGRCGTFGIIVEDQVSGDVYVHEYGHNINLWECAHRDDCSFNIMNSRTGGNNNSVNASECSGYGGRAYTQLCGNVYDGAGGPLTESAGPYWVTCNITVPAGATLTIQAGTEIQFEPGLRIKSYGYASGDGSTNQIVLYSNNSNRSFPSATVDGDLIIQNGGELVFD